VRGRRMNGMPNTRARSAWCHLSLRSTPGGGDAQRGVASARRFCLTELSPLNRVRFAAAYDVASPPVIVPAALYSGMVASASAANAVVNTVKSDKVYRRHQPTKEPALIARRQTISRRVASVLPWPARLSSPVRPPAAICGGGLRRSLFSLPSGVAMLPAAGGAAGEKARARWRQEAWGAAAGTKRW